MISLRTRLRHLAQLRRREGVRSALALVVIAGCYGIVGSLDYADAQQAEAEAAERRSAAWASKLAQCMNGQPIALYRDAISGQQIGVVCRKAWEVSL